jgi:hypothetical protein
VDTEQEVQARDGDEVAGGGDAEVVATLRSIEQRLELLVRIEIALLVIVLLAGIAAVWFFVAVLSS